LKLDVAKYYPEAVVVNGKGEIVARINPTCDSCETFPGLSYLDSFRDEKLRINDDRKVRMNLADFIDPACMILLLVKSFDTRAAKVTESAFAHSWFRFQNEQTN
jgi:hypothetical protein